MLPPETEAAIRARVAAITQEPWEAYDYPECIGVQFRRPDIANHVDILDAHERLENIAFIAAAPADMDVLLAEVDALRGEIEWVRDLLVTYGLDEPDTPAPHILGRAPSDPRPVTDPGWRAAVGLLDTLTASGPVRPPPPYTTWTSGHGPPPVGEDLDLPAPGATGEG